MSGWLLGAVLLVGSLAACAPPPVIVDLNFPSQETFLWSESARLRVFAVDGNDLGACSHLLADTLAGVLAEEPELDTEATPVCDFRNGGVEFPAVAPGPRAYVATTLDGANTILLSGCRVAEVYDGAPVITISLFPTGDYASATTGDSPCQDVTDKCERGCQ